MNKTSLQPNDVCVVLRPSHVEGEEWDKTFEVLVSGFGPVSLAEEDMAHLLLMGMMLACVVPMMNDDDELYERIATFCEKRFGGVSKELPLTSLTQTVGGMQ